MRVIASVPQEVSDALALTAQRYVGWFTGHPTRVKQFPVLIKDSMTMETSEWREPIVVRDDCEFCTRLTDAEAVRRVAGYQAAIDKEVLGRKWGHLKTWAAKNGYPALTGSHHSDDWPTWRAFIEAEQDKPRFAKAWVDGEIVVQDRPNGWNLKALPLVALPLRLKRKLCIEWNHCYIGWMAAEHVVYDDGQFYSEHDFLIVDGCDDIADLERHIWGGDA